MKKIINRMLIVSVLSVSLAGCTKDKVSEGGILEGEPTTVELKLQFSPNNPAAMRDATTDDPNATVAEAELKTVDVFIYSGAGDYLDHVHLEAGDFTQQAPISGADVWETTTPLPTTTGPKDFYVGVNLPADAASSLEHQSISFASTAIQSIARGDINITNGLPMFSTVAIAATMQQDAAQNKITAQVKRIVAKVTVEMNSSSLAQDGALGELGQLTWAINNQNSKYFLLQGPGPAYADPNWAADKYLLAEFGAAGDGDYVEVNDDPQSIADYNALYALENTSNKKTTKELTRVTVRATFIPDEWVTSYTAGDMTVTRTENTNNIPTDFYTVAPALGQREFFQNLEDANEYAADNGNVAVDTFTGGYCYWNIFLNKAFGGDVYRNDFYKCNITRIVAPGAPSDELTTPDGQPTTDTSITVAVNVMNWNNPVLEDYELIP